jgi:outer membrane protein assembly factor BamD
MRRWGVLVVLLSVLVLSCKSSAKKNPEQKFFDEVSQLTKEQVISKGDELMEKKHWEEARKYYSFLADSFPNDPLGRKASLRVADTFFNSKDLESLTEAQIRFKDFANRFPSDPNRGYALLMLGKCGFQQRRGAMRDLASLRESADNFQQVVKLYPGSEVAKQAAEMLAEAIEDLATHELLIARFYTRLGALVGAQMRVDYLLANYANSKAAAEAKGLAAELARRRAALEQTRPPVEATPVPSAAAPPRSKR